MASYAQWATLAAVLGLWLVGEASERASAAMRATLAAWERTARARSRPPVEGAQEG